MMMSAYWICRSDLTCICPVKTIDMNGGNSHDFVQYSN